jgi:hypothetical protein
MLNVEFNTEPVPANIPGLASFNTQHSTFNIQHFDFGGAR